MTGSEGLMAGYRQVISVPSRSTDELFVIANGENCLNVLRFNYHKEEYQLELLKTMKLVADCVCSAFDAP